MTKNIMGNLLDDKERRQARMRLLASMQSPHLQKSLPDKLEGWLEERGFVIRIMSSNGSWASQMSAEGCYPLTERTFADADSERADEIRADLAANFFIEQPDGTWHRSDQQLYVQSKEERDAWREFRKAEQEAAGSTAAIYEQAQEWNRELGGLGGVDPEHPKSKVEPTKAHILTPAETPSKLQRILEQQEGK